MIFERLVIRTLKAPPLSTVFRTIADLGNFFLLLLFNRHEAKVGALFKSQSFI